MRKDRLFFLLSLICFILIIGISFILLGSLNADMLGTKDSANEENESNGVDLSGLGIAIGIAFIAVFTVIYIAAAAIPTILKIVEVFALKRGLGITCIVFDVVFALLGVTILIGTLDSLAPNALGAWYVCAAALPTLATVFDIIGVKNI